MKMKGAVPAIVAVVLLAALAGAGKRKKKNKRKTLASGLLGAYRGQYAERRNAMLAGYGVDPETAEMLDQGNPYNPDNIERIYAGGARRIFGRRLKGIV